MGKAFESSISSKYEPAEANMKTDFITVTKYKKGCMLELQFDNNTAFISKITQDVPRILRSKKGFKMVDDRFGRTIHTQYMHKKCWKYLRKNIPRYFRRAYAVVAGTTVDIINKKILSGEMYVYGKTNDYEEYRNKYTYFRDNARLAVKERSRKKR